MIREVIARVKSAIFYACIYLSTVFYMLFMWLPRYWLLSEQQVRDLFRRITLFLLKICDAFGVHHKLEGCEHLEEALRRGGVIWASKHQSVWETIYLQSITDKFSIILKKVLQQIPLFGHALRNSATLGIQRDQGLSALKSMLKFSREQLDKGNGVLIFPEGSRTTYGEPIKEYQVGAAAMYDKLKAPVLPIALDSGKCWGRYSAKMYPGTITVRFLPIIEPGLSREEFAKKLNDVIESACQEMYAK